MNAAAAEETATAAPTDVCLTIDTEFSIAGAFADPERREPVGEDYVMCPTADGDSGLGFILRTLAEHELKATFFVEALHTTWFGDGPMGRVVERILEAGQDLQLHLHPCWLYFRRPDWKSQLHDDPPTDRCDGRDVDELAGLLVQGIATLRGWGAGTVSAFRTGNLFVDRGVYRAMEQAGVMLGSNIGLGQWQPVEPELRLSCGRHWFGDALELPITSYMAPALRGRGPLRIFTVAGTSDREARYLLDLARTAQVSPVVILTHPFEFAHDAEQGTPRTRPHGLNRRRLAALCRYLAEHKDRFCVRTFSEAGGDWRAQGAAAATELAVPRSLSLPRLFQNKMSDLVG